MSTILIAEDEEILRQELAEVLGKQGYRVLTAPDGASALSELKKNSVQLVISDLRMVKLRFENSLLTIVVKRFGVGNDVDGIGHQGRPFSFVAPHPRSDLAILRGALADLIQIRQHRLDLVALLRRQTHPAADDHCIDNVSLTAQDNV